jgi:hypothetical protein
MLILLFEDLVTDSRRAMRQLAVRLGIDPSFYDTYAFEPENTSYVARSAMLQDLNIRIREYLPKGRLYEMARSLYRAANTRRPNGDHSDPDLDRDLAEHYSPMLVELEQEFSLNLGKWRAATGAAPPAAKQDKSAPHGLPFALSTSSGRGR